MNFFNKNTLSKTVTLAVLAVAMVLTSMSGCKKALNSRDKCDVDDEKGEFEQAITAYMEDQTVANCERIKRTGIDYIRAIERCGSLSPTVAASARQAVKAYEDIDCAQEVRE